MNYIFMLIIYYIYILLLLLFILYNYVSLLKREVVVRFIGDDAWKSIYHLHGTRKLGALPNIWVNSMGICVSLYETLLYSINCSIITGTIIHFLKCWKTPGIYHQSSKSSACRTARSTYNTIRILIPRIQRISLRASRCLSMMRECIYE
jgi:hypothetical protein